jgi:sigma-B regulation protein RsbU (phosphoserine phosphatase)
VGASLEKQRLRDQVKANLERLEQELVAARALQIGMLPRTFPVWSPEQPVKVHAFMEPAREVGGDLYDCFYAAEGALCFLVGDVSGKGASAAMFMARTTSLVRMASELWQRMEFDKLSPASLADAVNRQLCENNDERMFVTLFLGFLNTRTGLLGYINAGHPIPYLLHASGGVEQVDGKPEVPLAVRLDKVYQGRTVILQPGDAIFVYSDGVIEAMNTAQEFYGSDRLESDLRVVSNVTPEEMVLAVKMRVDAFTGEAAKADDVTMLALRWQPSCGTGCA